VYFNNADSLIVAQQDIGLSEGRRIKLNTLKFQSRGGLEITGYFCCPITEKKIPCIVVASAGIHGSFFRKSTKSFDDFHLKWCWYLSQNNVATLYIDKRGSYGYGEGFQALNEIGGREVDDIAIGASKLLACDYIDPKGIYGYGTCRMSVTFILAELKYSLFKGLFLVSGVYDIKRQLASMEEKYRKELLGKYLFEDFPYEQRSPIYLTSSIKPGLPLLLVHGKDDGIVLAEQSVEFYQQLRQTHKKVQLVQLPELEHTRAASDPDMPSGKKILELLLDFVR